MPSYLDTLYLTREYGRNSYPQKLCNYIYDKYFKEYIDKNKIEKTKLLDVGSGKGNHLVGFSRLGIEVYGLDKAGECIKALADFDTRECNIEKEKFPCEDNFFDFIFSKSVLEHIENTGNFFKESLRVLKPGGIAIILTPDWKSQMNFFWDDYTHVKAFTRKGLQNAMKINGFSGVECEYFLQIPFVWKYPFLKFITKIIKLLPDSLRWRDKEENQPRKLIKFSKEKMLLAKGVKKT